MYAGTIVAIAHHISVTHMEAIVIFAIRHVWHSVRCTGIKGADPTDLLVPNQICGLVTCRAAECSAVSCHIQIYLWTIESWGLILAIVKFWWTSQIELAWESLPLELRLTFTLASISKFGNYERVRKFWKNPAICTCLTWEESLTDGCIRHCIYPPRNPRMRRFPFRNNSMDQTAFNPFRT